MDWPSLVSAIGGIMFIVFLIYRGTKKIKCACLTVEFDHNGDRNQKGGKKDQSDE
jgi:hypothetical protein